LAWKENHYNNFTAPEKPGEEIIRKIERELDLEETRLQLI
jgi:hypothetical protein